MDALKRERVFNYWRNWESRAYTNLFQYFASEGLAGFRGLANFSRAEQKLAVFNLLPIEANRVAAV